MAKYNNKGRCKECNAKLALASARFVEFIFDDEPYESGKYDDVYVNGEINEKVDSETSIYGDICPECGTLDNVWIDK